METILDLSSVSLLDTPAPSLAFPSVLASTQTSLVPLSLIWASLRALAHPVSLTVRDLAWEPGTAKRQFVLKRLSEQAEAAWAAPVA